MLKWSLCDCSDAYILVKKILTIELALPPIVNPNNNDKKVVFKNCALFIDCISEKNNTKIDNAKDIDVVTPMLNLIEYSNNYSTTSGNFWKYYIDEPALTDISAIASFWITLETPVANCKINLILTWSEKCVLSDDTKATTFAVTDTKLYVAVVTLSTQTIATIKIRF